MQAVHQLIDDVSYLANVIPSTHFVKYIKLSINIAFRQDTQALLFKVLRFLQITIFSYSEILPISKKEKPMTMSIWVQKWSKKIRK